MGTETVWSAVYRKDEGVIARQVAGEMLLVPVRGNLADMQRIFALNGVGEFIWNAFDGVRSLETIREDIISEFEVTRDEAGADIIEFVTALEQEGLIQTQ